MTIEAWVEAGHSPLLYSSRCVHCEAKPGKRRRQDTAYADDVENFARLCDDCQKLYDEYNRERWEDYYLSQMG